MHDLQVLLAQSIAEGLKRKSITGISKWAESYRVMKNGPWTFKKHPWLKEMHDSKSTFNVGQKAAQMGFTETVLNITLGLIDLHGQDVLYLLPSKVPDATDFSSARFDPALELSDHLNKMFSDVKNTGHKRAGSANLYVRGAQSRAGLKSIPVSTIIMDELEEFSEEAVPLALERTSGQEEKLIWMISTPSVPNMGINKYFLDSTMEHFFFKCPHCSRMTELIFPDCIEITADQIIDSKIHNSYYKCKECQHKLEHTQKQEWLKLENTEWVAEFPDRLNRGFHINQMYSPTITPGELAIAYIKGTLRAEDEQEFYNSKLGLTHVVEGAKVDDEQIVACTKSHKNTDPPPKGMLITMGVDVGKFIHCEIDAWQFPNKMNSGDLNNQVYCKVVHHCKIQDFNDLDFLMNKYRVALCVIDANPEKRSALSFAKRFYGRVKLCYYGRGINGKTINVGHDSNEPTITVDRTAWLDTSLGRFHTERIGIPLDSSLEYKMHIKTLVRVYEKDKEGNPVGKYIKGSSEEDHYAHARNYAEIALQLAASKGKSQDIGKLL